MFVNVLWKGLLWSALWMAYVYGIMKFFPWEMLHEYPEEIQRACTLKEPTLSQKRKSKIYNIVTSLFLFGLLMAFGLWQFWGEPVAFWRVFLYLFGIAMTWNVVDLLVMDWLIVCTLRPSWVILPGTEDCSSYGNLGHHFKGFLLGCLYMALLALLFAGIDVAILQMLT